MPNLFKVPQIATLQVASTVIGVFDASGSMYSAWSKAAVSWNALTKNVESKFMISFSTGASERGPILTQNIEDYDSGSTNICAGFIKLAEVLKNPKVHQNVTVIFVSDGGDDNSNTLAERMLMLNKVAHNKIINFITIGVGSGFPTFVAMSLRDIYHNGAASLPPLFLVNDVTSDSEWSTQTDLMKSYVQHAAKVPVTPSVKNLPWKDSITEVSVGSWVYSDEVTITVNSLTPVHPVTSLSVDEFIDISKGWLGELQLLSIRGGEAKQAAITSLEILEKWRSQFIDCEVKGEEKLTFNQRMIKKQQNQIYFAIQAIFKEFKLLANDEVLSKLTAQEAAQRLAIGTQIGKYHNNALNLRGITVEDYTTARDKFIGLKEKLTFESASSDQEASVISLQTQKDVFTEEDLIIGLKNCQSQYDLVENFPVVGHGIEIKRSDGAMINPFLVRVIGMARHHKVVDTVSLQTAGNQLKMNIGSDESETINAVIPLFSKKDADLKPLITSKLFHILMTFNVMGNADTCFENAYFALLANTCLHLLTSPASQWQKDTLELIGSTIEIVSSWQEGFKKYATALIETPRIAMVTENPAITSKCEDLSKPICVLFYLVWSKAIVEQEKIQEILHAIFSEAIGRAYPGNASISEYFKVELPEGHFMPTFEAEELSVHDSITDITKYYTHQDMKNEIDEKVSILKLSLGFEICASLSLEQCKFLNLGKLSLDNLNKVYGFFLPESPLPNNSILAALIVHADKHHNSYERNTAEIDFNSEQILQKMAQQKELEIIKSNKIAHNVYNKLLLSYQDHSLEAHFNAEPMTIRELEAYCNDKGIESSLFEFNTSSNLLKNACMSKKCPFFMVPSNKFAQHLEGLIGRCPGLHKTIKLNPTNSAESILEMVLAGKCLNKINGVIPPGLITEKQISKINEHKERYVLLINQAKDKYNKVKLEFLKDDETQVASIALRTVKVKKP